MLSSILQRLTCKQPFLPRRCRRLPLLLPRVPGVQTGHHPWTAAGGRRQRQTPGALGRVAGPQTHPWLQGSSKRHTVCRTCARPPWYLQDREAREMRK
jgi:hypothetical protein